MKIGEDAYLFALKQNGTGYCSYCGALGADTVDHKVARSRGGTDELSNLVLACDKCNQSKGAATVDEFIDIVGLMGMS